MGSEAVVEAGFSNNSLQIRDGTFSGGRVGGTLGAKIGPAGVAGTGKHGLVSGLDERVHATVGDGKLGAKITIGTRSIGTAAQHAGQLAGGAAGDIGRRADNAGRDISKGPHEIGQDFGGLFRKSGH